MVAAAVIGAGVIGATGSVIAGGEQAGAAQTAANTQLQMYNQTRQDLLPFQQAGQSGLSQLQQLLGLNGAGPQGMNSTLAQYPGYQFAMDQGVQALDRSAASRGLVLSGGQLKDVTSFGQGLASTQFNNAFNQLQALSSLGESAASQTGNAGATAASGAAQSQIAAGTANASGIAGAANQIGGLLTNQSVLAALTGPSTSPFTGQNLNNYSEDQTLGSLGNANYIPASDLSLAA